MPEPPEPSIYQLRAVLLGISPIIWRRLLVKDYSTTADLHVILQTAFGRSDDHLHRFLIHGKQYGVAYLDGITFRNAGERPSPSTCRYAPSRETAGRRDREMGRRWLTGARVAGRGQQGSTACARLWWTMRQAARPSSTVNDCACPISRRAWVGPDVYVSV